MKKKALLISAIASNQGKTIFSMALLHYYKKRVRPFKCGPDFIDPQFHQKISEVASVNLDNFMMSTKQVQWIYQRYFDKDIAIVEGVMGYYDGMDKGSSAYDISKILDIPSLLVLDAGGSYITISAIIKGICEFREDSTIKAVVLNKISSKTHYELVKKHIEKELPDIKVCGWIQKGLKTLSSIHLGLDLKELETKDIERLSDEVLKYIDLDLLESVMDVEVYKVDEYPFKKVEKKDALCVLIKDKNFSFVYHDNIEYLKEIYSELIIIDSTKDEKVPDSADIVIIPGGYVETDEAYKRIENSNKFRDSLKKHAKTKKIYAECAGLVYLGESCDNKKMCALLPVSFELENKRQRLGYYISKDKNNNEIKGHAFHYTKIIKAPPTKIKLYKSNEKNSKDGGYIKDNIFATYLHTMWRLGNIIPV
jgi:cobyrinic acid a,c-diamide synthase